ncbi:hypothetical protein Tco_1573087 [Tanacetum coccineum]
MVSLLFRTGRRREKKLTIDNIGILMDDDDVLNVQENGESSGGNDPRDRRQLWADLGFHKNVVYGCPWVLLGNFNVPLNMEDMFTGSSSMNSAMCEFKDCIENI